MYNMSDLRRYFTAKSIGKAIGMTLLAFLISLVLSSPLSFSAMSIFAAPEKTDFTISDFYQQIADRRDVRTLDPDIVLVDIGRLGRGGIAEVLEVVALAEPRAVGVDVIFPSVKGEEDSLLFNAINHLERPVMAMSVNDTAEEGKFEVKESTYFVDSLSTSIPGIVNFPVLQWKGTVREFRPYFEIDGERYKSFATAIVAEVSPESLSELDSRANELEIIDYPSREFTTIPYEEVCDRGEELTGKIVLVGAVDELSDVHSTPIDSHMPGVRMHAYILSQILGGRYYDRSNKIIDWIAAFLLCFGVIWLSLTINPGLKGLVIRVLQLVLVYCAIQIGYSLFVDAKYVTNFSYILLMLTFGLFAVDIWNGSVALIKNIKVRLERRGMNKDKNSKDREIPDRR